MTINPAATVLITRDHPQDGIQILLLKRNSKLKFAPSFWVFPGGRIDPIDGPLNEQSILTTAKKAASREALEEAGLRVDPTKMVHYCHWTTPKGGKRRFATWFFHCFIKQTEGHVLIDQSEIVDHMWVHPKEALNQMLVGKIPLLPPTFITLERLRKAATYSDVVNEFERTGVVTATPVTIISDGHFYCLYKGDAGYDNADITATNSLHRLIINQEKGDYRFEYKHCAHPPVNGGVFTHSS